MTWKAKAKEWGSGAVKFLTEDGELLTFVIMGEPRLMEGEYKGKPTKRIAAPVMTEDGFCILLIGQRPFYRLAKYESQFPTAAFEIERHGETGDTNAKYPISISEDKILTQTLLTMAKDGVDKDEIQEAWDAAEKIVTS